MSTAPPQAAPPPRPGVIRRFFARIWGGLNFIRRLVFGLIALLLALLFFAWFLSLGGGEAKLRNDTTLVFNPEGQIVEQFSQDPAYASLLNIGNGTGEIRLRDMLAVLRKAKDDKRINRVVLNLDKLQLSGWASTRDIAAAIRAVRDSGKEVIAYTEGADQGQYLLNATANQIYLDPMNGITLQGIGRYRQFYRELLQDKLGVDVQLFKVGTFKSAAEPYVLDQSSAAAKEADLYWMNDVWSRYLAEVAKDRKLDTSAFSQSINGIREGVVAAQGDLAQYALQNKWVDGLKTRNEFNGLIASKGVKDEDNTVGFRAIGFDDYLGISNVEPVRGEPIMSDQRIGIVVAEGEIVGGKEAPGRIGGESTSALLRDARKDDKVKAVVLRVSSPGGEVFASEQIRREVELLKAAKKPVVVSMGDVAASGGYWISMNADRIYADPSTITGSIGIFGMIPNFTRALGKVGVHTDGVGTTPVAGAFDPTRPMDPGMANVIQSVIEKGYRDFIGRVGAARKKPLNEVDAIAQGRVWTGAQARERGLVDEFGSLQDAVQYAASLAKLGKRDAYGVTWIEEDRSFFSGLFSKVPRIAVWARESDTLRALLLTMAPRQAAELRFIERVLRTQAGKPVVDVAHCFCAP